MNKRAQSASHPRSSRLLFGGCYARLCRASPNRQRADDEARNDCGAPYRPESGFRPSRRLLQEADDIGTENAADTPYPELHANTASTKACFIGVGSEIVEDMLGADHAKAGDRHDREIEKMFVDEQQRAHGDPADHPPGAEQTRGCRKSAIG